MDDQTELPQEDLYRVKYTERGRPGDRYTAPLSKADAEDLAQDYGRAIGVTSAVIVLSSCYTGPEPTIAEFTGRHDLSEEVSDGITSPVADPAHKEPDWPVPILPEVSADDQLDDSLDSREHAYAEDTAIQGPTDEEYEQFRQALHGVEGGGVKLHESWMNEHHRTAALEHAMKLATMPIGSFNVQTAAISPEQVVKNARVFLAFLTEGPGA